MSTKKRNVVLTVGIAMIVLTFVVLIICFIRDSNSASDNIDKTITNVFYVFGVFLPVLLEELTLMRSVYKLVSVKPEGIVKICYIISATLVCCALAFQILAFTRVITKDILPEGPIAASSRFVALILLKEWPVIIVSFILGSVRKNKSNL